MAADIDFTFAFCSPYTAVYSSFSSLNAPVLAEDWWLASDPNIWVWPADHTFLAGRKAAASPHEMDGFGTINPADLNTSGMPHPFFRLNLSHRKLLPSS